MRGHVLRSHPLDRTVLPPRAALRGRLRGRLYWRSHGRFYACRLDALRRAERRGRYPRPGKELELANPNPNPNTNPNLNPNPNPNPSPNPIPNPNPNLPQVGALFSRAHALALPAVTFQA